MKSSIFSWQDVGCDVDNGTELGDLSQSNSNGVCSRVLGRFLERGFARKVLK
jgi:hypothetical protein